MRLEDGVRAGPHHVELAVALGGEHGADRLAVLVGEADAELGRGGAEGAGGGETEAAGGGRRLGGDAGAAEIAQVLEEAADRLRRCRRGIAALDLPGPLVAARE